MKHYDYNVLVVAINQLEKVLCDGGETGWRLVDRIFNPARGEHHIVLEKELTEEEYQQMLQIREAQKDVMDFLDKEDAKRQGAI